ncbi:MAG: hypothetical protein IJJ82_03030 [Clostridia bacterium]|nr:hypothetical protein [Clostridia bacterium]
MRPVLKTKTIMNQFKRNGDLTLAAMADNYGMPEEEFLEAIKGVVGKENYSDLQRMNSKRLKAGKGKPAITTEEDDDEMKARVRKDLLEKKEAMVREDLQERSETEKSQKIKEDTPKELNNVEKLQEKMQNVTTIISTITEQLEDLNSSRENIRCQIEELTSKVNSLRLDEALQDEEYREKQAELENAKEEQTQLQKELDSLTKVILIAPQYGGKIPTSRTVISIMSRGKNSEIIVERVPKEEWMSQPSIDKMMEAGYDSLEKYLEAFEFVQLVLKYQILGKKYELRCPEKITNMIKAEGGEV